ncbi:hypothetical protein SPRG_06923 [Saprolegnia parasitica CBS 223.65]|uniref:Chitin-binding type-4 domain-containing protein n=1 Tax=Saprolegnia parasitica (strain CBS 223.65) TaxID=695850 RepID=A0A067CLI1_SAPPC|nr:hypothetical protein SPRG_06923 [Saprolegnia parasitica CBS 223.65]KDO27652.1 hypothetical protein SPRG_06923 [Saprolegnia parasitica CBS 223.65]|eukprot:XP_012201774.1 hypothetical protein SPRG_06923 [Saprolegnia parasitica CBS 223.65]
MKSIYLGSLLAFLAVSVDAHGRMIAPPARGFMGRLDQFNFAPIDYDDDGLSAGGIGATSGGRHGVCGDPYSQASPREHETGGKYGLFPKYRERAITSCYAPGAVIDIDIQITANHRGSFTFGLCKLHGKNDKETEDCFVDLLQPNGNLQWPLPGGNKNFRLQYALPSNVECDGDAHCVLRWVYTGGNNAGVGPDGQEHFWNCADIYISNACNGTNPFPTPVPTHQPSPDDGSGGYYPPAPTTKAPKPTLVPTVTPRPTATTAPSTSTSPPTGAPGDKCNGQKNVCYWPASQQIVPYGKSDCALFSSFVWCP